MQLTSGGCSCSAEFKQYNHDCKKNGSAMKVMYDTERKVIAGMSMMALKGKRSLI